MRLKKGHVPSCHLCHNSMRVFKLEAEWLARYLEEKDFALHM